MKHYVVLFGALLFLSNPLFAAESAAPEAPATEAPATGSVAPAAPAAEVTATVASTVDVPAAPAASSLETPAACEAAVVAENLEFISGEVSATDANAKSVTVKLYGEAENAATNIRSGSVGIVGSGIAAIWSRQLRRA